MQEIGKILVFVGVFIFIVGILLIFSDKLPFNLGRLPGDISYEKESFSFYFPITTSIILSVIFSFLIYLFGKFFR